MKRTLVVCIATLFCAYVVFGQAAKEPPKPAAKKGPGGAAATPAQAPGMAMKPGPEQKRLGYFIGSWHMEGDSKQSAFGPAGKFIGDEKDEWLPGGFFVLAHSEGKGPMGEEKSISLMGYDQQKKVYTYDAYNNTGMHETSTGNYKDGIWTWSNEMDMGGKHIKGHFIIKEASPTTFTFKFENSVDNGPWETIMEGKSTKK